MWKYLIPAILCVQLTSSLNEHESCVDNTNAIGSCRKLVHCESVTEDFKLNGIQPKICSSASDGTVIVCCRNEPSISLTADTNSRPTRANSETTASVKLEELNQGAWTNDKDSGYYSCNTNEDGDTSCIIIDASFTSGKKPEVKRKKVTKIGAPPGFMPDNGTGFYEVYSLYKGNLEHKFDSDDDEEVDGSRWAVFYQNELFIVKYRYMDKDNQDAHVMYYWIGKDTLQQDKITGEKIALRKADKLEGETTIVKVMQGAEPPHFLKLFNNNIVVLVTGEYNNNVDGVRFYRVRGSKKDEDMRVTNLARRKENLETDGVFVLDTLGPIYVWWGKDSTPAEQRAGIDFVKQFSRDTIGIVSVAVGQEPDIITVEQGEEPQAFWDAFFSPPVSEQSSNTASAPSTVPSTTSSTPSITSSVSSFPSTTPSAGFREPSDDAVDDAIPGVTRAPSSSVSHGSRNNGLTLYEAIVRLRGAVRFEKIPDFTQEDLAQDGAYILDTGEELYLWLGASLPERIKNAKHIIIEAYRKRDPVERTEAVFTIPQGKEPALFKRIFPSWDPNLFKSAVLSAQAGMYSV